MGRTRRKWHDDEDTLLKTAVTRAQQEGRPLLWHEIATSIPGRTNKDCRKRWYGKTAATVNKGAWTASEDERLYSAVKQHGIKWSIVASEVGTRTGDQCSKRWNHTVNPDIDRSDWTLKEDELLLDGVNEYGRNWQQITSNFFPRRTSLGAKNRYHLLCRRSEGARSYNKSTVTRISRTVPMRIDERDELQETDESDPSDSDVETDEEVLGNAEKRSIFSGQTGPTNTYGWHSDFRTESSTQPFPATSEADIMDGISGEILGISPRNVSCSNDADGRTPSTTYSSSINLDFANYAFGTSDNRRTQQCLRQEGPIVPVALSGRHSNGSTVQSMDDLMLDFSSNDNSTLAFDDQVNFDSSMTFDHESAMFGNRQSDTGNSSVEHSSASFFSKVRNNSHGTPTSSLSTGSTAPSSEAITGLVYGSQNNDIRRITIQAVCNACDIGKVVQAVTELSFSAVVKTDN